MTRVLYAIFIGMFMALFIGIGVALFYPSPIAPEPRPYSGKELSEAEVTQEALYIEKEASYNRSMQTYNRNVSMIVLICAVIVIAISTIIPARMDVIIQGLMFGSLFTLAYSIIRGMESGNNAYRFFIASLGLITSIIIGYRKFVRQRPDHVAPS